MSEIENNPIKIGEINNLQVLRESPQGLYLGFEDGESVLLPNKYVPENTVISDYLNVFIYTDSEDRMIATTLTPQISLNDIGVLKVREVNNFGAFMIWNIEKDIFIPFRNQKQKLIAGNKYPIYLYLDSSSNRLVGTAILDKQIQNEKLSINEGDEVDLIVYEHTDLGFKVIINKLHFGLIFHGDIFQQIDCGDELKGYIKTIRPDNKIDIVLQKTGFENIDIYTQKLLEYLQKQNGKIYLTDNSSPDEIKDELAMSKKQFKKAVGVLYKSKKIMLETDCIILVNK
jgi:predicted RNA-binding protein (virulence factor B family)